VNVRSGGAVVILGGAVRPLSSWAVRRRIFRLPTESPRSGRRRSFAALRMTSLWRDDEDPPLRSLR